MDSLLINCTPHDIVIQLADGTKIVAVNTSLNVRVSNTPGPKIGSVQGAPIYASDQPGPVQGLPDPRPGVYYLVSALAGAYLKHRTDVLVPGTGPGDEAVREEGRIIAVTRLKRP